MNNMRQGRLNQAFRRFRVEQRGSVSVEFMLIAPLLFWAMMATYTFFDGYRQSATNLKAANTVADLISRETEAVNDAYIDSMYALMQMMLRSESKLTMRITVVRWDEEDGRYYVSWSKVRNRDVLLNDGNIADIEGRLPVMSDDDYVILVETENTYEPLFNVGLHHVPLRNFVFSRPRFAPQVAFDSPSSST